MTKRKWRRLRGKATARHPHLAGGLRRLSWGVPFDVYEDRTGTRSRIVWPTIDYFLEDRSPGRPVAFARGSMIALFRSVVAERRERAVREAGGASLA